MSSGDKWLAVAFLVLSIPPTLFYVTTGDDFHLWGVGITLTILVSHIILSLKRE